MKIAITGASGFVGRTLQRTLREAGHSVCTIGRAAAAADVAWDPGTGAIDATRLRGIDAVIHLAGANIAQRWTERARREIRDSRVDTTALIARTMADLDPRPRVLVSVSGVGIYGDCGDELVDETHAAGRGFLAEVAQAWEAAALPAREAGIRVVHPRLGVVLHRSGGALAKMLPAFSLGVGGPIGSGQQWMPWVALADLLRALQFFVESPHTSGPYNLVGPEPVRNATFTRTLGQVLGRPAVIPLPAFAIRLLFGAMGAETLLGGQRASVTRLVDAGFSFRYPTIRTALEQAMVATV